MADHFSGPEACDDGAFITVRFRDMLPEGHPVRLIDKFIDNINVAQFEARYLVGVGKKGRAPVNVRLMLKVVLYAIFCRIYSARRIDYATEHFADFWFFTHATRISHDKISDFIRKHGDDIHVVFLETISLASTNNLLDFSALYEDGFKTKANASKARTYTLKGLDRKEEKISEALNTALAKLQDDKKDEPVRQERLRLQNSLSKIADLREQLQQRIAQRTEGIPHKKATATKENSRISSTDPDAEMMKQKQGGHAVSYLREVAVDPKTDIVVGSVVSGYDNEAQHSTELSEQAIKNCQDAGCSKTYYAVVADSGFTSISNCDRLENAGLKIIGPTQSFEHKTRHPDSTSMEFRYTEKNNTVTCPAGNILNHRGTSYNKERKASIGTFTNPQACIGCALKGECLNGKESYRRHRIDMRIGAQQRALDRYQTPEGKELYEKRRHAGEIFQGDLQHNGGFRQFLRRGLEKVTVDARLQDIAWNLRRIFNARGGTIAWCA